MLHYNPNVPAAARLSEASGFPVEWYGGSEWYLMPPPPPYKWWLRGAPERLQELELAKTQGRELEGQDFLDYYRERGLRDFFFFAKRIGGCTWLRVGLHLPLAWAWSAPNGTETPWGQTWGRFRMAEIARGHLKTTLLIQMYAAWCAVRDAEERILIYTHSDDFAEQVLAPVKGLFEGDGPTGELFVRLYGSVIPNERDRGKKFKWDQHNLTLIREGRYSDPTIKAKGFGSRVTGTHSTKQLVDDLVVEELGMTQMDKRIRGFDNLTPLYHSLALGERRMVGTPWGFWNPLAYAEKHWPGTLVARLPYKLPDDKLVFPPIEPVKVYGGCNLEEAERLRVRNPFFYACQFMCWPKDEGKMGFQRSWFRYFRQRGAGTATTFYELNANGQETRGVRLADCNVFILVDPNTGRVPGERVAGGSGDNAPKQAQHDFAAWVVVAVSPDNLWFVPRVLRARLNPAEFIDKTFELVGVWQPKFVAIEQRSAQILFVHLFREAWRQGRPPFQLVDWVGGHVSKEERIKGLIPRYSNGLILHRDAEQAELAQGINELEGELTDFPHAEHDDASDALSAAVQLVYAPGADQGQVLRALREEQKFKQELAPLDAASRAEAKWLRERRGGSVSERHLFEGDWAAL